MAAVANREIADFLKDFSVLLELTDANPFRIRACAGAARRFETLEDDIEDLLARGALQSVRGVGQSLAGLVTEFVRTGTATEFEEVKASVPPGVLDMLRIQGLGAKKVRAIHHELGIDTLEALAEACRDDRLSGLAGFGKKTQAKVLSSIEFLLQHQDRHRLDAASEAARDLLEVLTAHPDTIRAEVAGGLRRFEETVCGLTVVASSERPDAVSGAVAAWDGAAEVLLHEPSRVTLQVDDGMRVHLRLATDQEFPYLLHHLTGSAAYLEQMRARAGELGLRLDERGLVRDGAVLECGEEADLFAHLGLCFVPPELREGAGEIEAAATGDLPDLVRREDIRGSLHVHTTYSDGLDPLEAIARATRDQGYRYLGVCDHSRSAAYAGGLQVDDVRRQHQEIDALNQQLDGFRIFKGIESDILADGSLDYDRDVLDSFDFVVASVHSRLNMSEAEMTRRLVRALEDPATTILGHPTGRLLLEREAYPVDLSAVIAAAAARDVAIEINAHPYRLDLDWRHLREARNSGVRIAINTDAHRSDGLDHMRFGVGIARKGWLRREDVLNTLDTEAVAAYFQGAR